MNQNTRLHALIDLLIFGVLVQIILYSHSHPFANYNDFGKFKTIEGLTSSLNEQSFQNREDQEIFYAIHEVLVNMVMASRETIMEEIDSKITLTAIKEAPQDQSKMVIDGMIVRYAIQENGKLNYFFSVDENAMSAEDAFSILKTLLPITELKRHV